MAFVKKTWKDRIAEFPTRRRLTKEDNTSELVTVAREEGTLSQEGDAFSAENMNDLENRIDAEFTALNGKLIVENITIDTVSLKPSAFSYVDLDVAKDGYGVISAFMDVPANSADVQYSIVRHPTISTTLRIQAKNNTSMQTTFGGTVCVTYMKTN